MRRIYLDHMSTTPCDERVVQAMLPYLSEVYGNPHSKDHVWGWEASSAVEKARGILADILRAQPKEIVFTSGATEATNLALKGLAGFYKDKKHIVTTQIEHKCVLDSCRALEAQGFEVTYVPVSTDGIVDVEAVMAAVRDDTLVVSVMAANNEIGTLQPIGDIGPLCRAKKVFFHVDAAQAFSKIAIDVDAMCIDLLSISGHKIYGPKGIGALFVRRRVPRVRLVPLLSGGNQENGMRSGTLPTFLCVGLGEAARLMWEEHAKENQRMSHLKKVFWDKVRVLPEIKLNGDYNNALPHVINVSFADVEGEGLMGHVNDLAVSSGSACTSESLEPSYVLRAIGLDDTLAHTSLRVSFGRSTQEKDVVYAAQSIIDAVQHLRALSPLWEMRQAGVDIRKIAWKAH